jgi:hypothetical protein
MQRGGEWRQRGRFERVLGLYSLGVVSVQGALVGNDWLVWAMCWGRRRGLSPVMQAWRSIACCANGYRLGFRSRARFSCHGPGVCELECAK